MNEVRFVTLSCRGSGDTIIPFLDFQQNMQNSCILVKKKKHVPDNTKGCFAFLLYKRSTVILLAKKSLEWFWLRKSVVMHLLNKTGLSLPHLTACLCNIRGVYSQMAW